MKTRRTEQAVEFSPQLKIDASRGDELIRVDKLQRRFGDFIAVNNVSFSVRRGEIFGLLGANGAGKSTTFRMLCGLLPANSGELAIGLLISIVAKNQFVAGLLAIIVTFLPAFILSGFLFELLSSFTAAFNKSIKGKAR